MSKQIDFLKRCIALNLQGGGLLDLLDRIEELEREVERLKTTPPDKREDLRCVVSDLCGQVREARAERDALQADNARLLEALENCRLLAARHRKEEWAGHVLRLCESAGVAATVLRSPK